jgi:hypothetical protein
MFNSSNKLFDQIFELKFTSKQLNKQSQKCESEEKSEKIKAKKAMEKGKRNELTGLQCLNLELNNNGLYTIVIRGSLFPSKVDFSH